MSRTEPGSLLAARYRLRAVIRRDEMGAVWLATDGLRHLDVVLRAIPWAPPSTAGEQESRRERALREARALARLDHPDIVGVLDLIEDDGRPWMVFEAAPYRFPGRPLGDVVRADGPLQPEQAARVGWQVLAALRQAHAVGVLHRDLKPGSVLLGPGNRMRLADFGMVTADGSPALTTPEALTGSPLYMAPERARGEPATPASDLWSLGATLYAAVEGRAPFRRDGTVAVLTAVMSGNPDPPRRAGPLWPVISGLLRMDPGARPDAAGADWLLRRVAGQHCPAGPPPPAGAARPAAGAGAMPGSDAQSHRDGASVPGATAPQSPVAAPGDTGGPADFVPGFGLRDHVPAAAEPAARRPRRRWRIAAGTGGPGSPAG
jgi:eukaryotic-like serine/threonine-protein kinase